MDKEQIRTFLAGVEADAERRSEALLLLREGVAKVSEGISKLDASPLERTPRLRATGRGVSKQEALQYAEAVRRETPGIAQAELEARVTKRALADGKSTKGLLTRLRSALSSTPGPVLQTERTRL